MLWSERIEEVLSKGEKGAAEGLEGVLKMIDNIIDTLAKSVLQV